MKFKKQKLIVFCLLFFISLAIPPTVFAVVKRTQTLWITVGSVGVDVIPYIMADKKRMFVDFERDNFNYIDYINYKIEYQCDKGTRGIEGTFDPKTAKIYDHYAGRPFFRRELILGTSSNNEYVYHKNVRGVELIVNTVMQDGKIRKFTKILKFPDDQF